MMEGVETNSMTGIKSFWLSYGSLTNKLGLTKKAISTMSAVYPSGALLATKSVPTIVLAPGLFSIMMAWPRVSASLFCIARMMMSDPPPGP